MSEILRGYRRNKALQNRAKRLESGNVTLKKKYRVTLSSSGKPIENCFVLQPDVDEAARTAMALYAQLTQDMNLKLDLISWLKCYE